MAVAAYYTWDRLGRPLEPAVPIRELVVGLREAFPRAAKANLFSWYANAAHYENDYPQDHTPFSVTGWPLVSPQWWVFATDIMHRPDLGVDCFDLFDYYLAEAKAGRMPWLKYMIWRGQIYDVRNDWKPQPASGHYDHIHLSARTDHQYTHLGDWSVNGDDMTPGQAWVLHVMNYRIDGIRAMRDLIEVPSREFGGQSFAGFSEPNVLARAIRAIPTAAIPVDVDEAAIAAAVAEQLPGVGEIADAVNDDAASRLAE